jgi:hypothetical protein
MTPQMRVELLLNPTVDFIVSDAMADVPADSPAKKRSILRRRQLGIDKRATDGDIVTQQITGAQFEDGVDHYGGPGYNRGWYLKSLSQKRGVPMENLPMEYYYHKSAGEGSTIYIFDSGLRTDTPDIQSLEHKPEWLFVGMDAPKLLHSQWGTQTDEGPSSRGHGTCMLSLAVGKTYGVAKKASSVVVKYPPVTKENSEKDFQRLSNYVMGMASMAEHIASKNGNVKPGVKASAKAVINQSNGLKINRALSESDRNDYKRWFIERYNILMDLGAIITTSAGNEGVTQDISKTINVPQYWAGPELPLIVVGNIDWDIRRYMTIYHQREERMTTSQCLRI